MRAPPARHGAPPRPDGVVARVRVVTRHARRVLVTHASGDALDTQRVYVVRRTPDPLMRGLLGYGTKNRQVWSVTRSGHVLERIYFGTRSRALRYLAKDLCADGHTEVRVYDHRGALVIR